MARKINPEVYKHISISPKNTKMGPVHSISFPPSAVCGSLPCRTEGLCYIEKAIRMYADTKNAYERNWKIYNENQEQFWSELEADIKKVKWFRYFVGGDIPNFDFLVNMVRIANNNQHCSFLCFTKKYGIVNKYLKETNGVLPDNLHILYSGWRGLKMPNPYQLPEAHVMFKDGTTTAKDGARYCSGRCYDCAKAGCNCFSLKRGEQVMFNEH